MTVTSRTALLLGMALLGLGIMVGALLPPYQLGESLAAPNSAQRVGITSRMYDGERQLAVVPSLSPKQSLKSPGSGRITRSECGAGTPLSSGASLISLDGEPIIALHTPKPFWRDLGPGLEGDDVLELQEALAQIGFEAPNTGRFDAATGYALVALVEEHGGRLPENKFELARFLWLPAPEVVISGCSAGLGDSVALETELAAIGGVVESLSVVAFDPTEQQRVVAVADTEAVIGEDGLITDQSFLQAVERTAQFARWEQEGEGQLTLRSVYEEPKEAFAVPPAAIAATRGENEGCILTPRGEIWVNILGSELGQTFVQGELPDTVIIETGPAKRCG